MYQNIFGLKEAEKVYFHDNLLEFTEYSNFLQKKIKEAILQLIKKRGYANKKQVFSIVKNDCVAKEFEIPNKNYKVNIGRPRISPYNTFLTEYKRITSEFLAEHENIRLSSTPTKEMIEVFKLKDKQHIFYDINKLKRKED